MPDSNNSKRNIKVVQWTANGFTKKGKWAELRAFVQYQAFDVIVLNETHFFNVTKIPKLNGYSLKARIQDSHPGMICRTPGDTVIYYRNELPVTTGDEEDPTELNMEYTAITLNRQIRIVAVYNNNGNRFDTDGIIEMAERHERMVR